MEHGSASSSLLVNTFSWNVVSLENKELMFMNAPRSFCRRVLPTKSRVLSPQQNTSKIVVLPMSARTQAEQEGHAEEMSMPRPKKFLRMGTAATLQTVPNWALQCYTCSRHRSASASLQAGIAVPSARPVPPDGWHRSAQCHLMAGTAVPSAGQCLKKAVQKSPKTKHLK